jgi:hypothetical protein
VNKTGPDTNHAFDGGPDDVPPGNVPSLGAREQGAAEQRYSRRRRRMRVLAAMAAVATVAGVAVVALTAGKTVEVPAAPSPLSAVTGALARTSARSYTFSLDTTVLFAGKELGSDVVTGAFDPRHDLGTELLTARSAGHTQQAQIRFSGAYLYTSVPPGSRFGKPWDKTSFAAAAAAGMPPGDLYGFVSDQPVRPAELSVVLRSEGTAVRDSGPVSGPGWTGTKYTFTARFSDGRESVSGTVYVDEQGRVRRLVTITTREARRTTTTTGLTMDRDITFGGFGTPVAVSTPPANQVKYTSGQPYRGFYF